MSFLAWLKVCFLLKYFLLRGANEVSILPRTDELKVRKGRGYRPAFLFWTARPKNPLGDLRGFFGSGGI